VMALPAIDALAQATESGTVDVFCGRHSMAVFEGRQTIAMVRPCPERYSAMSALRFGSRDLRKSDAFRVVTLDRSRWLRLATRMSGAAERHSLVAVKGETRHESEVYLDCVRSIGIEVRKSQPTIEIDDASRSRAAQLVDPTITYAVIHPGGGQNPGSIMHEKRWPADRFADVARWLISKSIAVFFSGSPDERQLGLQVARDAGLSEHSVLATRSDLSTTAAIISASCLYVGGDTGVSHVAAATGVPVVAIFGPTNPRRYRPIGAHVRVIAPSESWELPDVDLRRAATRQVAARIDRVTTEAVIEACNELMEQPPLPQRER
jgi:heptosyltransferase II